MYTANARKRQIPVCLQIANSRARRAFAAKFPNFGTQHHPAEVPRLQATNLRAMRSVSQHLHVRKVGQELRLGLCPVVNWFRSDRPAADGMVLHVAGSDDPLAGSRNSAGHLPDCRMADIAVGHPKKHHTNTVTAIRGGIQHTDNFHFMKLTLWKHFQDQRFNNCLD